MCQASSNQYSVYNQSFLASESTFFWVLDPMPVSSEVWHPGLCGRALVIPAPCGCVFLQSSPASESFFRLAMIVTLVSTLRRPSAHLQGSVCRGLSSFVLCPNSSDLPGVHGLSALSPHLRGPLGSSWTPLPATHPGNSLKADRQGDQAPCLTLISQGSLSFIVWCLVSWEPLFHVRCLFVLLFLVVSDEKADPVSDIPSLSGAGAPFS